MPRRAATTSHRLPSAWMLGAVLTVLVFTACSKDEPPFVKPPIPVEVCQVQAAPEGDVRRYTASLVPHERVELAFKVGGYVKDIVSLPGPNGRMRIAQRGDRVTKGMVLAVLRDADYLAALGKAKAARDEELASLREAQINFTRYEKLYQERVVAKSELDKAKEKLDLFTASAERGAQQIQEASLQLEDTILKSPLDGIIVTRPIEKGTLATAGTQAFVLADLSSVKALFGVPDFALALIKPGDTIPITVEALGNATLTGQVTAISPSADPKSRVFDVEVTIPNPGERLKDGMVAVAGLSAAATAAARLSLPVEAVVRDPGDPKGFIVYAVEEVGGKPVARARKVAIGNVVGSQVILLDGPSLGQRVITTGATLVYDGAPVEIIQ